MIGQLVAHEEMLKDSEPIEDELNQEIERLKAFAAEQEDINEKAIQEIEKLKSELDDKGERPHE